MHLVKLSQIIRCSIQIYLLKLHYIKQYYDNVLYLEGKMNDGIYCLSIIDIIELIGNNIITCSFV